MNSASDSESNQQARLFRVQILRGHLTPKLCGLSLDVESFKYASGTAKERNLLKFAG